MSDVPDLAAIRDYHHRRDILGGQDRCRCGQRMPCDVLKVLMVVEAQAKRLAQWEKLAAEKNWGYVHDQVVAALVAPPEQGGERG